ncbi:MAG: hypothetical protein K2N06_12270 [Oscillospiraceae bacterium]|nr:hypothetical protein [Oscillospiraceae bacterium]
MNLGEHNPDEVNYLRVYADNKTANLDFLADYPNVETLFISGNFANVDGISRLAKLKDLSIILDSPAELTNARVPGLKSLTVYNRINEGFCNLLTESVESLELHEIRKLSDLSFLENVSGLKKLNLLSLPAVESLPDFEKLPNLYALRIYELHKLNNIESLACSNIHYLIMMLAADKLSGTKIADVLLRMERLEKANMVYLDRSSVQRFNVVENKFKKAKRDIPLDAISDYNEWERL